MAKMNNIGSFTNSSPNWNKTGTEPSASMKSQGFKAGYKPPAGFFNWFWTKVSKCITELQSKITSIVSFLSTDDFVFYKNISVSSVNEINALLTNTKYNGGDFIINVFLTNAATVAFGFSSAVEGELRISPNGAVLRFPFYSKTFCYNVSTGNWEQKYADVDNSLYYTKTQIDNRAPKPKYIYMGVSASNSGVSVSINSPIADQINNNEVGWLYILGTDFVERIELVSTEFAEKKGSTTAPQTYYIQTWHKSSGDIVSRYKIGNNGTPSAFAP